MQTDQKPLKQKGHKTDVSVTQQWSGVLLQKVLECDNGN